MLKILHFYLLKIVLRFIWYGRWLGANPILAIKVKLANLPYRLPFTRFTTRPAEIVLNPIVNALFRIQQLWCRMFDTPERKLYSTLSRVAPYGKWESVHGWRYIPCIGDSEIHWLLSPKMWEFLDKEFGRGAILNSSHRDRNLDTLEYYYQGDTGGSLKESENIVNYFKSPEKLVFKDYTYIKGNENLEMVKNGTTKESSDYHIIHKSGNIYRLEFDTNVGYENPSLFIRLKDG